jgi:GTPase
MPPSLRLPVLALVGRPNVGKSTLFNRLTGARKAIVDDLPGVTRDRNYSEAEWDGREFILIDTGGFEPNPETGLKRRIQEQSRLAIEEADVILFLLDGKAGINPLDREAVSLLRKVKKPVFFAVNKIDTESKRNQFYEFYALGVEELFPLSAEHGLGLSDLMEQIIGAFSFPQMDGAGQEEGRERPLSLAVVGRPNVGKSTLVNRLVGYERSVVDTAPGTTRDAIGADFSFGGQLYTLVDTAGIRRKARIVDRIERYSVIRSLGSVDRGDLVIHLLDGVEGVTDQDAQILAYTCARGKGLVLAVNKWDQVPKERRDTRTYAAEVYAKLSFVDYAPLVFISALTGYGIQKLMAAARQVAVAWQRKIQTATLNRVLQQVTHGHTPPAVQGKAVKFFYATQTAIRPPAFTLFVNFPKGVHSSYERYLVHQLRAALDLQNSPIRLLFRGRREEKRTASRR